MTPTSITVLAAVFVPSVTDELSNANMPSSVAELADDWSAKETVPLAARLIALE